jgi:CBS domain-containing protein
MRIGEMLDRKGHQVYAVRPEWTVREAAAVIAARNIGTTIVTDSAGALVGIISERDLVRALAEFGGGVLDRCVGGLMTASVVTCTPDTTVNDALSLMASHRIRHLPVVLDKEVLGLISIRDVLEFRLESLEENFAALLRGKRDASRARQAGEIANRAKTEFLANLSDKMKSALHAIVDRTEYLAKEMSGVPGSRDYLQDLQAIDARGRAVLATLDNAVELSRLQSNEREPAAVNLAVPELIASCIEAVRDWATRRRDGRRKRQWRRATALRRPPDGEADAA